MPKPYKTRAMAFLRKVIRVRRHLIANNKSQVNLDMARQFMKTLESFMNDRTTSRSMASVFIAHQDKIEFLMPGRGAANHIHFKTKLYELRSEAICIKNQSSKCKA
ncbi:MAG: hypothetical protein ACOCVX_05380 [Bacteroidales bacterium]